MSVVGFLHYYVHCLDPLCPRPQAAGSDAAPQLSARECLSVDGAATPDRRPVLLMAGYSYGAIIATQLPAHDTVMAAFATPTAGSAAAGTPARAASC